MPLPDGKNIRYRWKTFPSGKKVRLAFRGAHTVIAVKPKGGAERLLRRATQGSHQFLPDDLARGYRRVG